MKKLGQKQFEYYCSNTDFLSHFDFDITPYLSVVEFDGDETILHEGTRPPFLYYIISGSLKRYVTHENGRVSLVNFLSGPCFIGEIEMLQKQRVAKGVKAITACVAFAVDFAACEDRILNDNKFLRHLIFYLSRNSVKSGYRQAANRAWPLKNRLARFILNTSHNNIYRQRHTETSEYLGVTYRHLLYVIAELVEAGILCRTKRGYEITDRPALEKLAAVMPAERQI